MQKLYSINCSQHPRKVKRKIATEKLELFVVSAFFSFGNGLDLNEFLHVQAQIPEEQRINGCNCFCEKRNKEPFYDNVGHLSKIG